MGENQKFKKIWCQTFMGENQNFKEHGIKHLWVKIKSSRNMMSNICG